MAILILTLPPHILGGVATKAKILADYLRRAGQYVSIAFYAARGKYPELNVGLSRAFTNQRPKSLKLKELDDHNYVVVECPFPKIKNSHNASVDQMNLGPFFVAKHIS